MTKDQVAARIPKELRLYESLIMSEARVAAIPKYSPAEHYVKGMTKAHGSPDIPLDAPWDSLHFVDSPYDGMCFWLQVNLEDIPSCARLPGAPSVGMVWLFIQTVGSCWSAEVKFDPRRAADVEWRHRNDEKMVKLDWHYQIMLPEGIDAIDATDDAELECRYSDFATSQSQVKAEDFYFGGYPFPVQSEAEEFRKTVVCSMPTDWFHDCASVHLHFSQEKGWWGTIECH